MSDTTETTQAIKRYVVKQAFQIIPVIQYEEGNERIHTDEQPMCEDHPCPCNSNVVAGTRTTSLLLHTHSKEDKTACAKRVWPFLRGAGHALPSWFRRKACCPWCWRHWHLMRWYPRRLSSTICHRHERRILAQMAARRRAREATTRQQATICGSVEREVDHAG